jgi:hypothetical protein
MKEMRMKRPVALAVCAGLACLMAAPAFAEGSTLTNCDRATHHVRLRIDGQFQDEEFPPGHSHTFLSPNVSAQSDSTRPISLDQFYDYCIWKDGIAVQSRNHVGPHHP